MIGELRCGDVEAENGGQKEAEDGCGSEDWIDADDDADGEAPGEALRAGTEAKQSEDRQRDSAIDPVVAWRI